MSTRTITVGVLALQGAFHEHLKLLQQASLSTSLSEETKWTLITVRNANELSLCQALIIPGGESTTMSLVAARSQLLEPLRDFVKVHRKLTWGTCAGLILLAESANRTKKGGQDLIGGLDVRVNRNHFGRQTESFEANLDLPFLSETADLQDVQPDISPFKGVFIRAPIVERLLPLARNEQLEEAAKAETVIAPSRTPVANVAREMLNQPVEIMGRLPNCELKSSEKDQASTTNERSGDIVAVRQGNVFGTSFHPELTQDARIHVWWLQQVETLCEMRKPDSTSCT